MAKHWLRILVFLQSLKQTDLGRISRIAYSGRAAQPDSRTPSQGYGGTPRAIGSGRTNPCSKMKASRVRGCMRTSTGKKVIRATQPIGIVGLANPCAGSRSTGNGSALSKACLADQNALHVRSVSPSN